MILSITKQFILTICSFYLYRKILGHAKNTLCKNFLLIISSLLLSILNYYIFCNLPGISTISFILLLYLAFQLFFQTKLKLCLIATIISYGLSYALFSACCFPIITLFYYFHYPQNNLLYVSITILAGFITYLVLHIPFCFKRFRKGMHFLYNNVVINLGTIISIAIITCISYTQLREFPGDSIAFLQLLSIFLLGFLLLFWWKNQITKSYIEKLRRAELESLRQELTEKNHEIEKLRENNDALAHIIHRDNKLIPSMEHAVCEFLDNKDALSVDELAKKGEALAKELKEMAASRTGILHDYQAHGQHIPITGVCSVDALLSYMQKKAFSAGITFQVGISADLTAFTTSVVTPEDLSHLLSDLIENAIHAVKDCPDRNIQLHIHNISGNYTVEISDTGVPFPIEILQGYGIEQQTSHADDGGSGIGLMDIWNLKKKYRASMHIQEFDASSDTWCKKISVIFDSKNHYLIQTYRPEQILMTLKRSDLYVLQL